MTGLYGKAMHDFIIDELELGTRVAVGLDNEACGYGALLDLQYLATMAHCLALESVS